MVVQKKPLYLSILAFIIGTSISAYVQAAPYVTDLLAGQTIKVGTVTVWTADGNLHVKYVTTAPWSMTQTHLYVGTKPPKTASPGQFPYGNGSLSNVSEYEKVIPLSTWPGATSLYIAAHAVVSKPGSTPTYVQGVIHTASLLAYLEGGQIVVVGQVIIAIEGTNFVVTIQTTDGWEMYSSTAFRMRMPDGQVTDYFVHAAPASPTQDTFSIPLSELEALGFKPDWNYEMGVAVFVRKLEGEIYKYGDTAPATCFGFYVPGTYPPSESETAWGWGPLKLSDIVRSNTWGWYFLYVL